MTIEELLKDKDGTVRCGVRIMYWEVSTYVVYDRSSGKRMTIGYYEELKDALAALAEES